MSGRFITFEGGEGSGKSTQIRLLAEAFAHANIPCLTTREPGGTTSAESIRTLLLAPREEPWDAMTETVLFAAARVDHVRKKILPALRSGRHVLCDRFSDSTMAYQGFAGDLGQDFITLLHDVTVDALQPDLTFILDITPEIGLVRASARRDQHTRFEDKSIAFHTHVREAFLTIARQHPTRCAVVDASVPIDELQGQIAKIVRERLNLAI